MPTDTNTLVYNLNTHKYYATLDGVKKKLNINLSAELGSEQNATVFLNKATELTYLWLYGYIRPAAVRVIEYRIANDFIGVGYGVSYRDAIESAIYAQIEYMLQFDGDLEATAKGDRNMLVSIQTREHLKMAGMAHKGFFYEQISSDTYRNGY